MKQASDRQTAEATSAPSSSAAPAHPRRRAEDRLQFETVLGDLSDRFVSLPTDQIDAAIEDAQRRICECLHLDMSLLWQLSPNQPVSMVLTHKHQPPQFLPFPETLDAREVFPWGLEKTLRGETIVLSRLADAPPEAARDLEGMQLFGGKSVLCFPLSAGGGQAFGALGFVVAGEEREWTEELLARLKLVAEVFANALSRKRDDLALRAAEEQLRMATSAAEMGLWVLDAAGTQFAVNDKAMDLLGLPPGDRLEVSRFATLVHPEDRERVLEGLARALSSQELGRADYRILRPDGAVRWLQSVGRLHAGAAGAPPRLMGVTSDITDRKELETQLRQSLEEVQRLRDRLHEENVFLREQLRRGDGHDRIVGESEAVLKMLAQARRVAPTDATVLVTGETGTGKELLAQAIHDMSGRSAKAMVTVNCAALPPALIESELFGGEKGAYTGAMTRQVGRFELADGTSLFLDEIGDLPLDLQVKLLRVLQEGRFERLGSTLTITADVRVIAATNRDLDAMVRGGRFRADLYHRLNVYPIKVPPLRARVADIPLLAWKFVKEFNNKMGKSIDSIPRQTLEQLKRHPWPGNVRELRNTIERAMIVSDGRSLTIDFPAPAPSPDSAPVTLADVERKHIRDVLEHVHWRISGKGGAAEILGLIPTTLHAKMKKLGISRQAL